MSLSVVVVERVLQTVWPAACAACDRSIPDEALFCGACNLSINPLCGACQGCALPIGDLFAAVDRTHAAGPAAACRSLHQRDRGLRVRRGAGRSAGADEARRPAILARRLARLLASRWPSALASGRIGTRRRGRPRSAAPVQARRARLQPGAGAGPLGAGGLSRARTLASRHELPRLEPHLLERTRATRELGRAGPAARLAAVAGAFLVGDTARIRGRCVLVVDDVFTTGATFSACADALVSAGAAAVARAGTRRR